MKIKILFTVLLSTLLFSVTQAQSLHIGGKIQADLNKISGVAFSDQFTFGYAAGAFAEIGLGKKWGIQPEVLFTQSTVDTAEQFKQIYNSTDSFSNISLNYLTIPILLKYKLSKMISLEAGPQFGILLNQTENITQNGQDAFKKGDFSMVGGVQFNFLSVRAFARYAVGLNNIDDLPSQNQWKSQSIQVGVGYAFF